ncbi:hypothetical protein CesoFtcFv8_024026 [Champsocephalus esox]|uniref:Uncharacterized protein n=2 Tax=Champsocephalus TaxID=52236 RepID=A0AAN8CBB6_CHAGU|nr:hypothetical protein CesoFtcFv8_024026 [Champsocephalus esox]KAK5900599.1 hypothetical protein CgunFtcFv8_025547 [Champsocephalus gunnari]
MEKIPSTKKKLQHLTFDHICLQLLNTALNPLSRFFFSHVHTRKHASPTQPGAHTRNPLSDALHTGAPDSARACCLRSLLASRLRWMFAQQRTPASADHRTESHLVVNFCTV